MLLVYTSLPPLFCSVTSGIKRRGSGGVRGAAAHRSPCQRCLQTTAKDGNLIGNEVNMSIGHVLGTGKSSSRLSPVAGGAELSVKLRAQTPVRVCRRRDVLRCASCTAMLKLITSMGKIRKTRYIFISS